MSAESKLTVLALTPGAGWEPLLRLNLRAEVIIDADACRENIDRAGGHRVLKASYLRTRANGASIGAGAFARIEVTPEQVPLSRDDKKLFTHRPGQDYADGNTICAVNWPDKLPTGGLFVASPYLPEIGVVSAPEMFPRRCPIGKLAGSLSHLPPTISRDE